MSSTVAPPAKRILGAILFLWALQASDVAVAEQSESGTAVNLLWSQPIPAGPPPGYARRVGDEKGLFVKRPAKTLVSAGKAFMARRDGRITILANVRETGPGAEIDLPVPPGHYQLLDDGEAYWVAGTYTEGVAFTSARVSIGYVAKFDRLGKMQWHLRLTGGQRKIQGLAKLATGDIVVAGVRDAASWLVRIASRGRIVWEKTFGVAGNAEVETSPDRIIVTALDTREGLNVTSGHDLYAWIFREDGSLVDRKILRQSVDRDLFGEMSMIARNGAIYSINAWENYRAFRPAQVTRFDAAGEVLWQRELSQTVVSWPDGRQSLCSWAANVLNNGDLLLTCSNGSRIALLRFVADTGHSTTASVLPASCAGQGVSEAFPGELGSGELFLLASPGPFDFESCIYMAKLSLQILH